MPIATCIITPDCQPSDHDLIELWSIESGLPAEHMTINIITNNQQFGSKYKVMVTLDLPSLWSEQSISSLQRGLAMALSKYFRQPLSEVFIITNIVESGRVVEAGQEITW